MSEREQYLLDVVSAAMAAGLTLCVVLALAVGLLIARLVR